MNLFEYAESQASEVNSANVIDIRAIIVGFRIVWNSRNNQSLWRRKENREYLKNHIEYLKSVKGKQLTEYKQALLLSRQQVCF